MASAMLGFGRPCAIKGACRCARCAASACAQAGLGLQNQRSLCACPVGSLVVAKEQDAGALVEWRGAHRRKARACAFAARAVRQAQMSQLAAEHEGPRGG